MWGSPDVSTGLYIWKSLIPSFLGNAVGALLVGIPYRYLFIDDLSVFGNSTGASAVDEELGRKEQMMRDGDVLSVHEQLQLGGRTPGRSRAESTIGGGRTPSVKSGHE